MATVARENIGTLNDKLVVKITKEEYLPAFEKKLKEYSKTANIPGFRKGMVPAGLVKKMYGAAIFADEVLRTVEKELYSYLQQENPDIFAQPLPIENGAPKLDHTQPADYEFGFEIGLKPEFEIAAPAKAALTLHKVKVTDEMINEEVSRMQIKAGNMTEPETVSDPENVLNLQFTECHADGSAVEGGVSKENSVLLKYLTPAAQQAFKGKKKDEQVVMALNALFEGDKLEMMLHDLGFAKDDAAAAAKTFALTLTKIGLVEKHPLNEELFSKVFPGADISTEEAFRAKLQEEIEQYWAAQSRNQLHDQLYHYLIDETRMDFPASFLKRWLQTGGEKPKSAEEAEAEFPYFSNQLKWTLISDKIIKDNNLQVQTEELKNAMKEEVMRYFGGASLGGDTSWLDSYVDRMMKDEKHVDSTYRRLITEKLFAWAETQVSPKEKTVTPEELAGMMHNHHH